MATSTRWPLLAAATAAMVALLAAIVSIPAAAVARPAPLAWAAADTTGRTTNTIVKRVAAPGAYTVVVTVPALRASESISVFVGNEALHQVAIPAGFPTALEFQVTVKARSFPVRTVADGAPVHVGVAAIRESAADTQPP